MEPIGGGVRRRAVRRLWAGVVTGGLALIAAVPPADAQERQGTRIDADAGYGGLYVAGRRLPVTVTIRSDRLIQGSIEVTIPDQVGSWSIDVEVAGGGVNDFVVVVPTPIMQEIREVHVRLVGAGEPVVTEVEVDALQDTQLVGLLPGVMPPDLPEPLGLPADAGTARFVELDADDLSTTGALDPIGTVVADPEELGRLDAAARAAVLDWVDRGGHLAVDGAVGIDVAGVPDEWQPGDAGRAPAGLGQVRTVAGAAAAGRWGDVVEPTSTVSWAEMWEFGGATVAFSEPVGNAVARDAGLSALELPWLLFFLLAYVALVGPVAWFVLRRRRAALGWVVVPAVAALFTAGSFVVGSDLRSGTTAAHGTVLETSPAGARATTVLGLVSRNGRDGRGTFPTGWTAGSVDNSFAGIDPRNAGELDVHSGGGGIDATVPLAAGGFGVLRGSGLLADTEGGLLVDARSEGDAVVGTVRNDLPFAVEDVGILLGRATEQLGRIEAGGTAEFRFEDRELERRDPWMPPEATLWPAESGWNGQPRFDSVVNIALWNEANLALGPNARSRGIVTAIGWTRDLDTPAVVAGEDDPVGRSAVVSRAVVSSDDGSVAPGATRRELLRGPRAVDLPDIDSPTRLRGTVFRFTLPAGASAEDLAVAVPGLIGRVDAWNGSEWVTLHEALPDNGNVGCDPSQLQDAPLPSELVPGGVVLVRAWMFADCGGFDGAGLEVYRA